MRPMRRKDRLISEKDALEILRTAVYGVLATVGPDGEPYGVPLTYALDEDGDSLLFHCALEGRKLDNLRSHPTAQFSAVAETRVLPEEFSIEYRCAMATGRVAEVTDREEKKRCALRLAAKYSDRDADRYTERLIDRTCILRLYIEHLSGKRLIREHRSDRKHVTE